MSRNFGIPQRKQPHGLPIGTLTPGKILLFLAYDALCFALIFATAAGIAFGFVAIVAALQ